ncbi:PRMT5-domain-containing protein [Tuber magnatum]|uniref:PRMT5-domain-containing protein n=1 Tax=Tuber magnatum TaxID=42249 RepID=A0A317T2W1_9PEZI|nr:PRMT5-domain-containing protein [Tuber magnatum]
MDAHQPADHGAPIWYIGNHLPAPDLTISGQTLEDETAQGYDMITTLITNTNFRSRINQVLLNAAAEKRTHMRVDSLDAEEVTVHPGDYISQVIGFASPWLEFDSDDPLISHVSKQALLYELDYAGFCGIGSVVISGPRKKENVPRFAQVINTALSASGYAHLLILLPLAEDPSCVAEGDEYDELSAWDTWNTIRTICKYNSRLSLALQIPATLPTLHVMNRWFAEPIRVVLLSSSTFSPNKTGYPALSKLHQALLTKYTKQRPTPFILLSDQREVANERIRYEPLSYLVYVRHLQKNQPPQSIVERYGSGYQDYLQTPLQPLSDNLESITYEVFEKDPVKYDQYEKAIKLALDARDAASSTLVVPSLMVLAFRSLHAFLLV